MLDLRVLITTNPQAYLTRGGGEYELESIADGLRQLGIIADMYGPYSRVLDYYNVVLHFSVHPDSLELLREINRRGKPIVLWPNLWLDSVADQNLNIISEHLELSHSVAFKSNAELAHFLERTSIASDKLKVCKWIADMNYLKQAPNGLFKQLYGMEDFALWVGIIEPVKNQLAALRVLREKRIPTVIVGRYRDKEYYQECRDAAGSDALFLESLPQKSEIIRSALQSSCFYLELPFEPPGLSAIEAGLSGCRMLLSDSAWAREHFGSHAIYADPTSECSIAEGIDRVLQLPRHNKPLQRQMIEYCFPNALDPLLELLKKAVDQ